ncbi:hypothetical protein QBC46DRAFT_382085 [Diplogelasinospora grovesii]|uniref:Uncharacterized protein n=1 Tax=Diplogelasinospora grovesii TaxID=303347 RepID=A0AAN6NAF7_9PEZI|nr:hypothetical protein QBC46DRAFT_382085 [Diplogelasinospora grovesii]
MSVRPGSSASNSSSEWTRSPSRSSGASTRYRERRLPDTPAVNTMLWICGRNPKKVKAVRVYETFYPEEDYDARSNRSGSSWTSGKKKDTEIYFLEYRGMSWMPDNYSEYSSPSASSKKHKKRPPSGGSGRASRSSHRSGGGGGGGGGGDPWARQPQRQPHVESDDDDDSGSDGSAEDYGGFQPEPQFHPGMHPGMGGPGMMPTPPFPGPPMGMGGPPPGAFQPGYGPIPTPPPPPPQNYTYTPAPPMGPPPPPQGGGGHFVRQGNLQVFESD